MFVSKLKICVQEIHSSPLAVVGIAEFTLNLLRHQLLCSKQIDTAPVLIIILIITNHQYSNVKDLVI